MLFYRENIMFQCGAALESFNGIRQLLGDLRRAITTHRKKERSLSWHFGGTGKMRKCFLILYFVRSLLLFFFGFVVRSSNGFFMDREETNWMIFEVCMTRILYGKSGLKSSFLFCFSVLGRQRSSKVIGIHSHLPHMQPLFYLTCRKSLLLLVDDDCFDFQQCKAFPCLHLSKLIKGYRHHIEWVCLKSILTRLKCLFMHEKKKLFSGQMSNMCATLGARVMTSRWQSR